MPSIISKPARSNSEYALSCLQAARDGGAAVICLCDTNGATMPEEISQRTREAVEGAAGRQDRHPLP